MNNLIVFVIAIIITEAITNIVSKAKIFEPLKEFFFIRRKNRVFKFIHDLLDCPYCLSVWVGTFVSIIVVDIYITKVFILDKFIIGLLLHRTSNILHNIIDRTRNQDFMEKG